MIGVSSRVSASFANDYTAKLFQSASVEQSHGNRSQEALVKISGEFSGSAAKAIDSILSIVMDANGDSSVEAKTDGDVDGVKTSDGDDNISLIAARAYGIGSGGGDDTVSIETQGSTVGVFTGNGDDATDIDAGGNVGIIAGGDGDDAIDIQSDGMVAFVNGGTGDDTINIAADEITLVTGGSGDDTINITNNGDRNAQYYYFEGDGTDKITSNGPVEINLFSEDGTSRQDIANGEWSVEGNTVTVTFADGGSLSATIEGAESAEYGYDADKGSLVIRAASNSEAAEAEALAALG